MPFYKVTIKEIGRDSETKVLTGDYDLDYVRNWFGLNEPNVEWYTIEKV